MTSPTELLANLKIESKEAEEYLSRFASLSDEENKTARPAAIEKLFPLLFGDIAAIESSESFAQLRQKPW